MLQSISNTLKAGRSGLIAASLLGLAAGAPGCAGDGNGTGGDTAGYTDVIQEDAPDVNNQPEYGAPPMDVIQEDAPDVGNQPEYGVPADVEEDTEPPVQPMYGVPSPPDAGE
jgi:hypothetical protein